MHRRQEIRHHSDEQIRDYLIDAEKIVRKANLPTDLQPLAFVETIRLLAAKQIVMEQFAPSGIALPDGALQ